ncbi:MAG: endonuclease III [Blastocatellia bacterium]|nr:endonuclease III [Blastocatellia bacterium]
MSGRQRAGRRPSGPRAWDEVAPSETSRTSPALPPSRTAGEDETGDAAARTLVRRVVENLDGEYGAKRNRLNGKPLDTLVGIILSQQNSSASSHACFSELKRRFPTWEDALAADVGDIEDAIRRGGLARIKAERIKAILRNLLDRHGSLELAGLSELPTDDAVAELVRLPGVGPKTARCVLLFALGADVFPMDVHIFRIAERLGIIAPKTPDERAHRVVGALIPDGRRYSAHVNMVEHGRTTCRPTAPKCDTCCLLEYCVFGQYRLDDLVDVTHDPRS